MSTRIGRREMLRRSAGGMAALGLTSLTLRADAQATPSSGTVGAYGDYLRKRGETVDVPPAAHVGVDSKAGPANWVATEDNILGPFYREGSPFRGKVTPPLEPGHVLLITGRVWGLDTRKPLANTVIDLWQANEQGRYDNDDPHNPPAEGVFINRCRIITDATGTYEYETIHPGAYKTGPETWRPPHVHYLIRARGYATLVTQLYFEGDPHQKEDEFIKASLIIPLKEQGRGDASWKTGVFDIVLQKA
jgi:catechol 1,2-dioxygenase